MIDLRVALILCGAVLAACSSQEHEAAGEPFGKTPTLEQIFSEPDRFRRHAALADRLGSMDASGVAEVVAALRTESHVPNAAESLLLIAFWASHEPEPATRWAMTSAPPSYRAAAIAESLVHWARTDPEAVIRELQITGGTGNQPALMAALIRGWHASGKPGLADYVRDLGPGFDQQRAIASWARAEIHANGALATANWAETWLPDLEAKAQLAVVRQVGSELTRAEPDAGVAWCNTHCEGPHGDALRQLVATRWASREPEVALDWVASANAADPLQRQRAMRAAFRTVAIQHPARALSWIEKGEPRQLSAPWMQPAVEITVGLLMTDRPPDALRWSEHLTDTENRHSAQVAVLRSWRESDPQAGDAWLETATLASEVVEEVLAPPAPETR
jgi:hypothetical protein